MKLGDIFTYGKPMFADKLVNDPLIRTTKRSNRFLLLAALFFAATAFIGFDATYTIIPRPYYKEDVQIPTEVWNQLPQQIQLSIENYRDTLPSRSEKPWYDLVDFTGRFVRHNVTQNEIIQS